MGRHSVSRKRRKRPFLLLGLSLVSVGSPVGLLAVAQPTADADPKITTGPLPQINPTIPNLNLDKVAKDARQAIRTSKPQASHTPTATAQAKATIAPRTTSKSPERSHTATASPRTTSTTVKPSTAQRSVQRAPSSSVTRSIESAGTRTTPKPPPPPPPPRATSTTAKATTTTENPPPPPPPAPTHDIVGVAKKYVDRGIPYVMGGNSLTGGMDCSHFVWMVLKEAGHSVTYRDSSGLAKWATRTNDPQPGDLVLFSGHVGIFVGNGMMVDQGSSGGAHLRQIKFYDNFIGYGRIPI